MIDLSKLNKGDRVKLACGGEATIRRIAEVRQGDFESNMHRHKNVSDNYRYAVRFEKFHADCSAPWWFNIEGQNGEGTGMGQCPFDIIEIIPKAFDWSEVRPGMAFHTFGGAVWYIGPDLCQVPEIRGREFAIFAESPDCKQNQLIVRRKSNMTRAEEHDITL